MALTNYKKIVKIVIRNVLTEPVK